MLVLAAISLPPLLVLRPLLVLQNDRGLMRCQGAS
jgi:hypothetical protein